MKRVQNSQNLKRTISGVLLIAAAVGLLVAYQGHMTTSHSVSALFAFAAGVALLAKRAK